MRIAYCAHVRLPSERAHGHQIAHVCDAMAALGHEVTLFAPTRRGAIKEDYHTYYGANTAVRVRYLPSFDQHTLPVGKGAFGLWLSNISLRRAFRKALTGAQFDLLYIRSPALLPALLSSGIPVLLELHQLPRRNRKSFIHLCNNCRRIACLTSPMRDELLQWGVDASKLLVEGDAVDLRLFQRMPSTNEARTHMGFQTDRMVVGYVGRLKTLGMEKGVSDLLHALRTAKTEQTFFGLVVGGPEQDKEQYEAMAKALKLMGDDVRFTGAVLATAVPTALAACDVLVMPFPDEPHYRKYMSPLKMFEYMASGKPIITSDLPPVRDVLSEKTAVFCQPGSADSLLHALRFIATHPDDAASRARAAATLVQEHSWEKRMERILQATDL
ncbi:MAG: glycosyltransferase [Candidatus Peribacteraceae bacterium]|nr:glycosyltransferase [Candidatus Peribacteraceae bacterium]